MASERAAHLRDAFFDAEMERFDVQYVMTDIDSYVAEQVTVISNYTARQLRLVPLPYRESVLQQNWNSEDGEGNRVIIMSRAELDMIYEELFEDAITYLRRRTDLPVVLRELVVSEEWRTKLFEGSWVEECRANAEAINDLLAYFERILSRFPSSPGPLQGATHVFADYVMGRIKGYYRPWVYLSRPLGPSGEDTDEADVQDKVLIKYRVDEPATLSGGERAWHAALGEIVYSLRAPVTADSSSHIRIRLPPGLVFSPDLKAPAGASRHGWKKNEAEFYFTQEEALNFYTRAAVTPFEFRFTATQASTMRYLVAALFLILGLLPPVLAYGEFLEQWEGLTISAALSSISLASVGPTLRLVSFDHVSSAANVALPLGLALVAAAWERPAVRAFAVTQLVFAVTMVALWAFGAVSAIVGGVTILLSLVISAANISRARRTQRPLPEGRRNERAKT